MEQSTFWELINKFAFNLFKIKEVANILIKPKASYEDFSSETKTNILLKSKTIIQSFRTNLKAIIKKSEYAIFDNDELINKTAKELSDIIDEIAPDNKLLFLIAKCNSLMNIYLCTITVTMDALFQIYIIFIISKLLALIKLLNTLMNE